MSCRFTSLNRGIGRLRFSWRRLRHIGADVDASYRLREAIDLTMQISLCRYDGLVAEETLQVREGNGMSSIVGHPRGASVPEGVQAAGPLPLSAKRPPKIEPVGGYPIKSTMEDYRPR